MEYEQWWGQVKNRLEYQEGYTPNENEKRFWKSEWHQGMTLPQQAVNEIMAAAYESFYEETNRGLANRVQELIAYLIRRTENERSNCVENDNRAIPF